MPIERKVGKENSSVCISSVPLPAYEHGHLEKSDQALVFPTCRRAPTLLRTQQSDALRTFPNLFRDSLRINCPFDINVRTCHPDLSTRYKFGDLSTCRVRFRSPCSPSTMHCHMTPRGHTYVSMQATHANATSCWEMGAVRHNRLGRSLRKVPCDRSPRCAVEPRHSRSSTEESTRSARESKVFGL